MGTLKPHSNGPLYSSTVIGTLAGGGWAVTFGTARRGLGMLRSRPIPLLVFPRVLKRKKKIRRWKVLNLGIGPEKVLILVTVVMKNQLGQHVSCDTVVVKQFRAIVFLTQIGWQKRIMRNGQKGTKVRPDFWYLRYWKILNFYRDISVGTLPCSPCLMSSMASVLTSYNYSMWHYKYM